MYKTEPVVSLSSAFDEDFLLRKTIEPDTFGKSECFGAGESITPSLELRVFTERAARRRPVNAPNRIAQNGSLLKPLEWKINTDAPRVLPKQRRRKTKQLDNVSKSIIKRGHRQIEQRERERERREIDW